MINLISHLQQKVITAKTIVFYYISDVYVRKHMIYDWSL